MKNLLVTGGAGFIGSNFIRYLLLENKFAGRIINVDKLTYAGNPESLAEVTALNNGKYVLETVDICDRKEIERVVKHYDVDAICHFAAESHVDRSILSPDDFIRTNIFGTYTLLEVVRANAKQIELFHHVSTDEVFGSLGKEGYFTETSPYQPNSPYSASKASSDHIVRAYHETYKLPVTISNCSNNYGPLQFPEKLIPLMILNALEGKALPVYGDGKNVRDWLYVRDHCTAIWDIMQRGKRGDTYAVGGRSEMENLTVVHMITDLLDSMAPALPGGKKRRELITFVQDRPGHDRRYAIDSSKIEKELGWAPAGSFETGLKQTIEWYLNNPTWIQHVRSGEYRHWIEKNYAAR